MAVSRFEITSPDVTAEELDAALHAAGSITGATRVVDFQASRLGGSGLVGAIHKLKLRYSGPPGPASAVLKLPSVAFPESAAFVRIEGRWYREDMPERSGIRAPRMLGQHDDEMPWLLLEDLGDGGFVRQINGCTPAQAAIALDEVAGLHARWWPDGTVKPPDWLQPPETSAATRFCRDWLRRYRGRWPDELGGFPELLIDRIDELTAILSIGPITLVHGDFHSQNMSFAADGTVRLVDFQFAQHGAAMTDVARFLATSLTTTTRRAAEHQLLRRYFARRTALGVTGTDADIELKALRAAFLWNLAMPLALRVMRIMTKDESWPASLPMLGRCIQAVRDWNADDIPNQ